MTKKILILETSGRVGRVAVASESGVLGEQRLDETRRHARDLAPAVQTMLRRQGWRPRDLDAVFVSLGPGSYTGLRVGVMAAKALAHATGCALVGVETFAALAYQARRETGEPTWRAVEVVSDAQRGLTYRQRFEFTSDGLPIPATPLQVVSAKEWLAGLEPTTCVTGPYLADHLAEVPAGIPTSAPPAWDVQAASLFRLGWARLEVERADDPIAMEPLYLRPSSAEEKWQALGK